MPTKKSPPEKIGLTPVAKLAKDLLSADPDSSGPAQQTGSPPPAANSGTDAELELQRKKLLLEMQLKREDQAVDVAAAFNEETRREVAAKALAEKIKEEDQGKLEDPVAAAEAKAFNEAAMRLEEARAKALALTVDELMNGVDLALENMAAGMTQSEAVRRAAETIRSEKVASQKLDPSG